MGVQGNDDKKKLQVDLRKLMKDLRRRARSLGKEWPDYLQTIYDIDRTLEVDRAILATVLVWGPILALLAALALSPQGKDLLDQFASDARLRFVFLVMLAALDVVATIFSTTSITVWFFPRIADARFANASVRKI